MTQPDPARRAAEGDVRITTYRRGATLFINVYSARGIGRGRVACAGDPTLRAAIVRLHLRGLEHLAVTADDVTVNASAASHGDYHVHQSVTRSGSSTPIGPDDPLWLTIERRAGRFDVMLPPALIAAASLALEWVDFYR